VFGDNYPLSMTIRTFIGPNLLWPTPFDRVARARAAPDRQRRCGTAFVLRIRPPGTAPTAAPERAVARAQANPDA